jgi:hypothetical protein
MMREHHVRFCEGLGVKLPGAYSGWTGLVADIAENDVNDPEEEIDYQ